MVMNQLAQSNKIQNEWVQQGFERLCPGGHGSSASPGFASVVFMKLLPDYGIIL